MGWLTLLPKLFNNFQDPDVAWVPWVVICGVSLIGLYLFVKNHQSH